MFTKALYLRIILLSFTLLLLSAIAYPYVLRESDKTYIVDQTGERWDVTQAKSIGFKPERFQYGIGRNAFMPLDDSYLSDDADISDRNTRIIGVEDGSQAQAYSVRKLMRHEIANSKIGSKPIAVGY
jgi:hypothetical protein